MDVALGHLPPSGDPRAPSKSKLQQNENSSLLVGASNLYDGTSTDYGEASDGEASADFDLLETMQKPCWYLALSMAILSTMAVAAVSFWFIALVVKHDSSVTPISLEDQPCYTKDPTISSALYTTRLEKVQLDTSRYPLAVCNDGSPGAYFFKKAIPGIGRDHIWNLYFQGGHWCSDYDQCQRRRNATYHYISEINRGSPKVDPQRAWYATSSDVWADEVELGGLFAPPRRSPLYGVNQMFVGFCSSDAWLGELPASQDTFGMHFQGLSIWKSAVQELLSTHGLQAAMASGGGAGKKKPLLLLGGYSAGARATMFHVDRLRQQLGPRVNVYAMMDSAVWLDIPPEPEAVAKGKTSLKEDTIRALDFFRLQDRDDILDPRCLEDHREEQWKCLFGQYRLGYVQTPYSFFSSQRDAFMETMLFDGGIRPHTSDSDSDSDYWVADNFFKRDLHTQIAEAYLALAYELKGRYPENVFFLNACLEHTASFDQTFLNWVTNKDFHTTMLSALEKGLERVGYIEYDKNSVRPCSERIVKDGNILHLDLLFQDTCYPVGKACGSCDYYSHEEQGNVLSSHELLDEFVMISYNRNNNTRLSDYRRWKEYQTKMDDDGGNGQ